VELSTQPSAVDSQRTHLRHNRNSAEEDSPLKPGRREAIDRSLTQLLVGDAAKTAAATVWRIHADVPSHRLVSP
jgi:hypothetical protein